MTNILYFYTCIIEYLTHTCSQNENGLPRRSWSSQKNTKFAKGYDYIVRLSIVNDCDFSTFSNQYYTVEIWGRKYTLLDWFITWALRKNGGIKFTLTLTILCIFLLCRFVISGLELLNSTLYKHLRYAATCTCTSNLFCWKFHLPQKLEQKEDTFGSIHPL